MLAEAIAGERARLAAILHRMPAGLVVVDAMTGIPRVVLSNTCAIEILGPPPADDAAEAWLALRALDGSPIPADTSPLQRALPRRRALRQPGLARGSRGRHNEPDPRDRRSRRDWGPAASHERRHRHRGRDRARPPRTRRQLLASGERPARLLGRGRRPARARCTGSRCRRSRTCAASTCSRTTSSTCSQSLTASPTAERVQHLLAEPIPLGGDTPVATAVRRASR